MVIGVQLRSERVGITAIRSQMLLIATLKWYWFSFGNLSVPMNSICSTK